VSVLDLAPVGAGSTAGAALRASLALVQVAERLGYHRYWVAEHHGGPSLAGPSPEALIGPIAAATERLRVGSGGVMLPHYSPLKVAQSFSLLAGLFPGRIDLGIGRAAGTDPMTAFALQRDRRQAAPDDFPDQLAELMAYFDDSFPDGHALARYVATLPGRPEQPDLWLLGSSAQSAIWAAELGLPYSFADFINREGAGIAEQYRKQAQDPHVSVGVWTVCAETDEEAERIASSGAMMMALLRQGRLVPVPPPEKAMRFVASQGIDLRNPRGRRRRVIGGPETVRAGIEQVADEYGAEEVILVTITYDHETRRRSYELIADAFGLAGARETPGAAGTRR